MASPGSLHIRMARVDEFNQIGALAQRAFIHDPQFNYFGRHKKVCAPAASPHLPNLVLHTSYYPVMLTTKSVRISRYL
jgi:hypothetical protein